MPLADTLGFEIKFLHLSSRTFSNWCLCIGPCGKFVCESFKSSISIPYRPTVLLDITSIWLNQTSQEFISSADSKIWSAWSEAHSPHHSRESPHFWDPFWSWIVMQGRVFLSGPCLCLPHLPQYDLFILHWGVAIQLLLRLFSKQIVPHINVYFLWLWEEVSSGLYFATIFNCLLPQGVFFSSYWFNQVCVAKLKRQCYIRNKEEKAINT